MADPLSRKASRADVSVISLAREGRSSKTGIPSALLTDRILLSPLDFAGEYMALETDPHAAGLQIKPSSILEWIKSQYSYDPLFRGDPVGQSEQPHSELHLLTCGTEGILLSGSDTCSAPQPIKSNT